MMTTEIVTAIISAVTTLAVSLGTWHVSMKQYRAKNMDMVDKAISEIKDTMTQKNAEVQEHLSIIDLKVETLSERVDKHNNLVERMYKVEQDTAIQHEQIAVLRDKIS